VPTMFANQRAGYVEESGLTVLSLNYLGGGLQFVVILPSADETFDAVAARLTTDQFARWSRLGDTNGREVLLYLPKFKVAGSTVALGNALRTLGMKQAFDIPAGTANFDGIAPRTPSDYLSISDVFHQTFVAVDEQGTEAAAATAVVISTTSAPINPPTTVRVDRPFLFAIQDRATGALLFFGRITDPR
jgi:serpin B